MLGYVAYDYAFKEISVMELCFLHFHVGLGVLFFIYIIYCINKDMIQIHLLHFTF